MELPYDKNGKIMMWKIVYCCWAGKGDLLNPKEPVTHAYVTAPSAVEAIKEFKRSIPIPAEVVGQPVLEPITQEEYDTGSY